MPSSRPTDIFICYRTDDAQDTARLLHEALARHLDVGVFFDDRVIQPGDAFPDEIHSALEQATCMLVVIGDRWLTVTDKHHRRRIDVDQDWVRREVERALARQIHVLPLLVHGAAMPETEALPVSLQALAGQQFLELRPRGFDRHLDQLIDALVEKHGWQRVTTEPGPAQVDLSAQVAEYRRRALALHRSIPVIGFETRVRVPVRLDDLYVPLRAMPDLRPDGKVTFADGKDALQHLGDADVAREITLSGAFAHADRLGGRRGVVILGDPGSGKTTYLRRLLLWLCSPEGPPAELGALAGAVPIFVPLRDARPGGDNKKLDLEDVVGQRLRADDLAIADDFPRQLLGRNDLVFLLDGLDEVADEVDRAAVAEAIERLRRRHPTAWIVVTCRYAGYSDAVRLSEHFVELHVRPLDDTQVDTFIRNWYAIVERSLEPDTARADALAAERSEALRARIREREFRAQRVYELTHNPLLLTAICLVHRDRGELPRRRADLYEECTHVLLEGWRRAKQLDVVLGARQARTVLQPLAYWLHGQEGRTRASSAELMPLLEPVLQSVARDGVDARTFLRTIRDQSGLLTGWSDDTYGFMHLGFQEYLTALEIRSRAFDNKDELTALADRFGTSWWQEVILLLMATGDPPLFEPLMRLVCERDAFVEHEWLVKACVEDTLARTPAPFVELLKRDPGDDPALWRRQAVAFRVLRATFPAEAAKVASALRFHPFPEMRAAAGIAAARLHAKTGIEFVEIPAGVFTMGSHDGEKGRFADEGPLHQVHLEAFWMSVTPVTNAQFQRFLEATAAPIPPFWGDRRFNQPQQPVVGISWDDAVAFCRWAGLRLPTEAEWEYACRAGTTTRFWSGDFDEDLARVGWYEENSEGLLQDVRQRPANPFGLHDMHGTVWEWCQDEWHESYRGAPKDGRKWVSAGTSDRNPARVVRGGSWGFPAGVCRSACRGRRRPGDRSRNQGFRVCLAPGPVTDE